MAKQPPLTHAVLTGDLIGSIKAGPLATDFEMIQLAHIAEVIGQWTGMEPTRFTRYRGDGWQIVLNRPQMALRAALSLIAGLAASDGKLAARIAIGIGSVTSLGSTNLSDAAGQAFARSGQSLDAATGDQRLVLASPDLHPLQQAVIALLGERSGQWTSAQAGALLLALDPTRPTLSQMSQHIGITLQSVSYRLRGAGWPAIRETLDLWEAMTP